MDDLGVLLEFFDEGVTSEEELDHAYEKAVEIVDDVEFRSTLNREEDELSCILEINAVAGGTESCDWSEMVLRMYIMWGEKNGYKVSELNRVNGDVAGIKSAEIEIKGEYAYGMLKGENGVHRLVRVSPYNAQGKRMTSFCSVFVHPEIHGEARPEEEAHIIRELLEQGYAVIAPDYRGSVGYGADFWRLIDYGGLENEDVFAGKQWMLEHHRNIDPQRVGILGWSHGGMITLMNIFEHPHDYQVAYAGAPVCRC